MDSHGLTRRHLLATAGAFSLLSLAEARAQGVAPKAGGTLTTVITPEPPLLVPGVNNQGPTLIVTSKIYQGLISYAPDLTPLPALAKSWELSDDKLTYTFHLQPNVKFHDGRPMTADDVIFSIMKFHMELAPRARGVFSKIKAAEAPDPQTVKLTLDSPFEPFLLMFDVTTCAIVPKHLYDGADYRNNPANQHPVGTGPFAFDAWQRGSFIRLKKFADYWKPGQPYLDQIIYRIVPDSQSRALALETGQVQMTQFNDIEPFDVPRFQQLPTVMVETKGWEYFAPLMWLDLNNRVKPLDDVRVRQAISHALDRDFIVKRLWFGVGKPATSPIASATRYHDPDAKLQTYDLEAAAKLLDDAGLKPDANGVRFTIKHLAIPYGEIWSRLSEYIRASLGKVGIQVVLETTDAGSWAKRVGDWDYETAINFVYQYGDPTLGVERTYVSSNIKKVTFANTEGYANPAVDKLFETGRMSADPEVRKQAFYDVQKLLTDEVPVVWLMEMSFPTIHDRRVTNLITTGTGVHACFDDVFIA
jgi:peptide/nickel transport system substrate-binding protein